MNIREITEAVSSGLIVLRAQWDKSGNWKIVARTKNGGWAQSGKELFSTRLNCEVGIKTLVRNNPKLYVQDL